MRNMISNWIVVAVSTVVVVIVVGCSQVKKAEESETTIAAADVPPKVMDAVNTRFPGAELTKLAKSTEDIGVIYDIELTHAGRKYEMDIKQDGTPVEIETAIAAKDLPAPVSGAVQAKYPNATIKEVMQKTLVKGKDERVHEYEVVLVTAGGKETEVTASLDGALKEE